MCYYNVELTR